MPKTAPHYHIKVMRSTVNVEPYTTIDRGDALQKFEDTVTHVHIQTGDYTRFHGRCVAEFYNGSMVLLDICYLDCLN